MISKPKHLTWNNLSDIYKKKLLNRPIYYTWKADGYITKITFSSQKIFFKIYNKERTTLSQEINYIDLSFLNKFLKYKTLNDIIIYGEFMSSMFYRYSRHKIFLFDLSIQNLDLCFIDRYEILKLLLSKISFIDIKCNLVLEIKKCTQFRVPIVDFHSYYNKTIENGLEFQYQNKCYAKCDGVIIYDNDNNKCYKVKYQNTFDLWLETISGKLYTEDLIFMGYIGPINSSIIERKNNPFNLVEVCKYNHSIYYTIIKYRDDKKKADSYITINHIDSINPRLLCPYFSNLALKHLSRLRISHCNLLTFEYRILKEELLLLTLKTINSIKKKSISWLDIGCGSGHELNTFISLRNKLKDSKLNQDSIYLCDLNISHKLNNRKYLILQQHESIKQLRLIKQSIYNSQIRDTIPYNSLDMITMFLSISDLNTKLFKNLNYLLKSSGKVAIIFYDTTHLSPEGMFNINYNFGLKPISKSKIRVFRNNRPRWCIEERLNIDKVIELFKKFNYRKLSLINNESLDRLNPFSEMLYGIIFIKHFSYSPLQNLLFIDIIQYKICQYLLPKDLMNLKIIFPLINWINKNIVDSNVNKVLTKRNQLLPLDQDILNNLESLDNIHNSSDESYDFDSDYGYLSW